MLAILALGVLLFVLGLIGGFFGSLIRAAVSRQREFLADASAVQFTRNPEGISGALKRIGGYSVGSKLKTASASDFSHMFFGSALSSIFATHPPLEKRIKKIEPNWDSSFPNTDQISENVDLVSEQTSGFAGETFDSITPECSIQFSSKLLKDQAQKIFSMPNRCLQTFRRNCSSSAVNLLRQDALYFPFYWIPSNSDVRDQQISLIRSRLEKETDKLPKRFIPILFPFPVLKNLP